MPMYKTVLVVIDRWRRVPIEWYRRDPDAYGEEIVDSEGATRELYRLLAPYDVNTTLLYSNEGLKIRVKNHAQKFESWRPHLEFYYYYEEELAGPPPKFKLYERNPQPEDPTGFIEVANLPQEPFFGAAILPSGEWVSTPEWAGPTYMARLLRWHRENLAIVVEVRF
ncbi:MAG: hypothetical protein AVDCRST_MAG93-624 [uncultured Chloroflexia bacterium]|uniref:Uncharacterized protein n=1 Tax=uncultured Chloroflexia bacterium TaxID=1672391 RepID=A0A6J4HM72_9CHLR|nr:MAG: hypothetical protein AVDCRST_MAG93-624 [uncultured Chloroflexia bacterium]